MMSNINDYIKSAEELVLAGKRAMLGKGVTIDGEGLLDLLQKIRQEMPEAIKEARQVIALRDKRLRDANEQAEGLVANARKEDKAIRDAAATDSAALIKNAQDEAAAIIEDAREQRDNLLSESAIIKQAHFEADAIRASAEEYRADILREVGGQIDNMLAEVEDFLNAKMSTIKDARIKAREEFN